MKSKRKRKRPKKKEVVEVTPEKVKSKKTVSAEQTDDSNLFSIADAFEEVPSPYDYQISLKETKQKGMEKNQQSKKKYPNPVPKPADKEKKAKEKAEKKTKQDKVAAPHNVPKKAPHPAPIDVPFFQNELVKPLVYVVGFVSLLSIIYLVMS